MRIETLTARACDKSNFTTLGHYVDFCRRFIAFVETAGAVQARIISSNEQHYQFLQFKNAGYSITRPLNSKLFYGGQDERLDRFHKILTDPRSNDHASCREIVNRSIYTIQQAIGCSLDALPAGQSNTARKINGDLFERLIRLVLLQMRLDCTSGVVKIPIEIQGEEAFQMNYQHDLIVKAGDLVKIIGSVKTSSKDRLDKIFVDKYLLARLTGKEVPHVAVFLNDVQRKGANPQNYGVSATFLPGRFKGYSIKLNPLDGVYYFDIRPNMQEDQFLKKHIRTFDHFVFTEIWEMLSRSGIAASEFEPRSESPTADQR